MGVDLDMSVKACLPDLPPRLAGRLVVCAGVYRSGSTWAYNMVESIIQAVLPGVRIRGHFAETVAEFAQKIVDLAPSGADRCDLVVLKTHPQEQLLSLLEFLKAPVILSVRDPRDCAVSWMQMLDEDFEVFQPRLMRSCSTALRLVKRDSTHTVRYEDGATASVRTVMDIAAHLGLSIAEDRAAVLVEELSPKSVKEKIKQLADAGRIDRNARLISDAETLWLPAHVGDGRSGKYREALSENQIRSVNCWSRAYCEVFGYDVPPPAQIPRGGNVLSFGTGSDALYYLRDGFSFPEPGYTWTDGVAAMLVLPLAEPITGDLACEFRYFKPESHTAPPVKLTIMLLSGGIVVSTLADAPDNSWIRFEVNESRLCGAHELTFRICIEDPFCPRLHGTSPDGRQLGIALQSIALSY